LSRGFDAVLLQSWMMSPDRPLVRAPEFPESDWINTYSPVSLRSLRGQVVLIDFFEYTCINCIRTLPYLRAWHDRYLDMGLTVIAAHTPEFSFSKHKDLVTAGAARLGVSWPVAIDNNQQIWTSFANRAWPTLYLVDPKGYLRFRHEGEGGYRFIEEAIQKLLLETQPGLIMPELVQPVRPEDEPFAACYPITPELQTGQVGNSQKPDIEPDDFTLMDDLVENRIYLDGRWRLDKDGLVAVDGSIHLPYKAADVYAVLAPAPNMDTTTDFDPPILVEITQDGEPVTPGEMGTDVFQQSGKSLLRLDLPRTYHLIKNSDVQPRQLRLHFLAPGGTFYAFSFGSCLIPAAAGEPTAQE
jgi:thiol-disulfide isomerase/thioredoxin